MTCHRLPTQDASYRNAGDYKRLMGISETNPWGKMQVWSRSMGWRSTCFVHVAHGRFDRPIDCLKGLSPVGTFPFASLQHPPVVALRISASNGLDPPGIPVRVRAGAGQPSTRGPVSLRRIGPIRYDPIRLHLQTGRKTILREERRSVIRFLVFHVYKKRNWGQYLSGGVAECLHCFHR